MKGTLPAAVAFQLNTEVTLFPKALVPAGALTLLAAALVVSLVSRPIMVTKAASNAAPAYAKNGDMPPAEYREWVYLTTGIDMSYAVKPAGMEDHQMFDNVFVNPEAYRSFKATGTWPDKTVMVLEGREARSNGSINKHGHFQGGGVMDLEVHVKDEARFPGKWAFFSFEGDGTNGKLIPQSASCYSCHASHAAVDTTFVQFYPTLLPIAQAKGTLSAAYLKDEAEGGAGK